MLYSFERANHRYGGIVGSVDMVGVLNDWRGECNSLLTNYIYLYLYLDRNRQFLGLRTVSGNIYTLFVCFMVYLFE